MVRVGPPHAGEKTRIGVIACDALRDEIELLLRSLHGIVYKEYVDFGHHLNPPEMRRILVEKVNALEGRADAVFLGYAVCQSLQGLPDEVNVPTVMLECEDCIAALLGPDRYSREKHCGQITWFYPSGWAKYGMEGVVQLFHLDSAREQGYEPTYFLKLMFDGFKRCLFIDTGAGDMQKCECNSRRFAKTLDLRHESTIGTLAHLSAALAQTREIALEIENGCASPTSEPVMTGAEEQPSQ
jgi:hypothetical protein